MQDIVTASPNFDIDGFIPALKIYLTVNNPYKRQFLISWIAVLASVPDIDMLTYLPELLGGLINMLSDPNREIRQAVSKTLQVSIGTPSPEVKCTLVHVGSALQNKGAILHLTMIGLDIKRQPERQTKDVNPVFLTSLFKEWALHL